MPPVPWSIGWWITSSRPRPIDDATPKQSAHKSISAILEPDTEPLDGLGALQWDGGAIEANGTPPIHPSLHSAFGPRETVEAEPTARDSLNRALGVHACIAVVRFKSVDEWEQGWLSDLDQALHRRSAVGMQW